MRKAEQRPRGHDNAIDSWMQGILRQDHGQNTAACSGKSMSDIVVLRNWSFGSHCDRVPRDRGGRLFGVGEERYPRDRDMLSLFE